MKKKALFIICIVCLFIAGALLDIKDLYFRIDMFGTKECVVGGTSLETANLSKSKDLSAVSERRSKQLKAMNCVL